jgi:hypothetical protein
MAQAEPTYIHDSSSCKRVILLHKSKASPHFKDATDGRMKKTTTLSQIFDSHNS